MRVPVMHGLIDRRILVNYRVDPAILARLLPAPFRPKVVRGAAMAGICLIRLKQIRPRGFPGWLGISSENAAHRAAVEWDDGDAVREGVFVRRRDTSSWLSTEVGGRFFPGVHHRARFTVAEDDRHYRVALVSNDGVTKISLAGRRTDLLPTTSIFASTEEASDFFQRGSLGYSVTSDPARFQGLELRCRQWSVAPLEMTEVRSSFFDDPALFPPGSIQFDCALLMRDIAHQWHGHADLCCPAVAAAVPEPAPHVGI